MVEIEIFLVEHVFINLEDGRLNEEVVIIREIEDNQMKACNNCQDNRNPLFEEESSAMEQDGDILQHTEQCMMMMIAERIQESYDSQTNDWCMHAYCSVPKAEPRYRSCFMQRIVTVFYRLVSQVWYKL
jgi:hypothetical protein